MKLIPAGILRDRIKFSRGAPADDGFATNPGAPAPISARWSRRTDVSDGERIRAAEQGQSLTSRFLVRADALTRSITGKDIIAHGALVFEVSAAKRSAEWADGIEISAVARPDQGV